MGMVRRRRTQTGNFETLHLPLPAAQPPATGVDDAQTAPPARPLLQQQATQAEGLRPGPDDHQLSHGLPPQAPGSAHRVRGSRRCETTGETPVQQNLDQFLRPGIHGTDGEWLTAATVHAGEVMPVPCNRGVDPFSVAQHAVAHLPRLAELSELPVDCGQTQSGAFSSELGMDLLGAQFIRGGLEEPQHRVWTLGPLRFRMPGLGWVCCWVVVGLGHVRISEHSFSG